MLYEEQGWSNGNTIRGTPDNMAVKEGLKVVVAMVLEAFLRKDGIDIGERFWFVAARLVVDDADALRAVRSGDDVETINDSTEG